MMVSAKPSAALNIWEQYRHRPILVHSHCIGEATSHTYRGLFHFISEDVLATVSIRL